MDIDAQRKEHAVLKVLADAGKPLGSTKIAKELEMLGIDLKERMVRYYLEGLDDKQLTRNLGRPGREITRLGRQELEKAVAIDKVGYIIARVDELAYNMSFDLGACTGKVIMNVSSLPAARYQEAREVIGTVLKTGLGMGEYIAVGHENEVLCGYRVQPGEVAIGTVCSVTLNGVFRQAGIPVSSRFGGLLELQARNPVRFTQIINYDGTTLDPLEIFIRGRMTNVADAARTGDGTVGASFREIPAAALPAAEQAIEKLASIGLGGVLVVGKPDRPLLEVPVAHGRAGIVVAAGLNPIAAVQEAGVQTESRAMATLYDFKDLESLMKLRDPAA